jgi:hypothetical protein
VQFARNLENNASYASLEPYTPQNITKMIKDGKLEVICTWRR